MPIAKNDITLENDAFSYLNYEDRQNDLPIDNVWLKTETVKVKNLCAVIKAVQNNSFSKLDPIFSPFTRKQNELTVEKGVLMWGYRVVVPHSLSERMLRRIHASHFSMVKTKSICRSYIWWPN